MAERRTQVDPGLKTKIIAAPLGISSLRQARAAGAVLACIALAGCLPTNNFSTKSTSVTTGLESTGTSSAASDGDRKSVV